MHVRYGLFGVLVCGVLAGCATVQGPGSQAGFPLAGLAQLKAGDTMRSSSTDPDLVNGNGDARPIEPGAMLVLADLEGPGTITHFWNTIASNEKGYSRLLVLRMYWDGEEHPSVECPIGDFFGIGHGVDQPYESLPMAISSEGRARNCYWPMPFKKSAKITVTNEGKERTNAFYYYVDWMKLPALPAGTAYFHASYRQEHPTVSGKNYLIADIAGRGHYVGTVQSVRQHTASWYGEGDDFFYIDGETLPRLTGTGTEDYFCDAWGFRQFSFPYYGVPLHQGYDAFDLTSAYRWHIADPVNFSKSLRVEIEHKGVTFNADGSIKSGFEERSDDFSSVAYWYQVEPHKILPALPPAQERLYYDWSGLVQAENELSRTVTSEGILQRQEGGWSGGAQILWQATKPDQTLTHTLNVTAAGTYELVLLLTHSWDYGIYEVQVDGKVLGPALNLYGAQVSNHEYHFALGKLEAGTHTLTLLNKGKDAASTGYFAGFDGYLLSPLD